MTCKCSHSEYKTTQPPIKKEETVFYVVWRPLGGGSPSLMLYATFNDAAMEAQRLADKTQKKFCVLKVISVVSPNTPLPPKLNYTSVTDNDSNKLY